MKAKEVTLLTGFLGAGKTTVLNAVIAKKKDTRFAIIENEIGEESIDAGLILQGEDDIMELNNGCLCCTLNDNIYELLNSLWDRRDSWDHLIIEATGIADPANIAHPFLTSDNVKRGFDLKRVICIVDAELIEDQLKEHQEAIKQIAFSDLILLNKVEKVSAEYVKELQAILKAINPFAEILIAEGQNFPVTKLFARERFANFYSNPKPVAIPKGIFSLSNATPEKQPLVAFGPSHNRHEHSDIETVLLKYKESMNIQDLEHRMMVFLIAQSANVYRVKGIIYSHQFESRIILQTVGKSLAISLGETWLPDEIRETKIVVIGKDLKLYGFDKMFRTCLYSPSDIE
ncbi:GTP-binding protein [Pedobacter sp. MC2016-15]|uniref:CobW family GTP-binding protein n=1 Tax=Pedobacter sp. MC2016-15 TaxID=2994473 RepID=UPI0022455F3C|nr:GTP-binding protein [Pedobacter sp. MC2016-15]MCX2477837.1 GTP-binding protein [Pedobacter sp. MC2016-15]